MTKNFWKLIILNLWQIQEVRDYNTVLMHLICLIYTDLVIICFPFFFL